MVGRAGRPFLNSPQRTQQPRLKISQILHQRRRPVATPRQGKKIEKDDAQPRVHPVRGDQGDRGKSQRSHGSPLRKSRRRLPRRPTRVALGRLALQNAEREGAGALKRHRGRPRQGKRPRLGVPDGRTGAVHDGAVVRDAGRMLRVTMIE